MTDGSPISTRCECDPCNIYVLFLWTEKYLTSKFTITITVTPVPNAGRALSPDNVWNCEYIKNKGMIGATVCTSENICVNSFNSGEQWQPAAAATSNSPTTTTTTTTTESDDIDAHNIQSPFYNIVHWILLDFNSLYYFNYCRCVHLPARTYCPTRWSTDYMADGRECVGCGRILHIVLHTHCHTAF